MSRAVLLSEFDLTSWIAGFTRGERSAPLPYGIDVLGERGIQFVSADLSSRRWAIKTRDVLEHRTGVPTERALRVIPKTAGADAVFALLEPQAYLAGRLKAWGLPPFSSTPLIVMSCWLAERASHANRDQRAALRQRLRAADLITHMSRHEAAVLVDLGLDPARLAPMTFGVADGYFTPDERERDIDVLAVGQDSGRDYATLFEAVRGTELRVTLVCKPANLVDLDVPPQVELVGTVSLARYRELLRRARVVVVPTHDFLYPTGQSVALEASACGTCVVVTGTRAMRDYFTDGDNGLLVDVGDAEGLRGALERALSDAGLRMRIGRRARTRVEEEFNSRTMWNAVADTLAERGIVPVLEAD